MSSVCIQYVKTPYGELILGAFEEQLCLCDWRYRKQRKAIDTRIAKHLKAKFVEHDADILKITRQQLDEYFHRERKQFNLPVKLAGTSFQQQVWQALQKIPFGETSTYAQLAKSLGQKTAVRAVANANGANAISIIIPCHRVIGSNGNLTGYAGGLKAKAGLLDLETDLFQLQP